MLADVSTESSRAAVRLELARLALVLSEPERARSLATRAHDTFQAMGNPHVETRCRLVLGRAAAATSEAGRAREHWRAALDGFETVGAADHQLETLELLVESHRDAGNRQRVQELCEQAESVLETAPAATADQHGEWL
jgi:hypothetical protein